MTPGMVTYLNVHFKSHVSNVETVGRWPVELGGRWVWIRVTPRYCLPLVLGSFAPLTLRRLALRSLHGTFTQLWHFRSLTNGRVSGWHVSYILWFYTQKSFAFWNFWKFEFWNSVWRNSSVNHFSPKSAYNYYWVSFCNGRIWTLFPFALLKKVLH